MVLNGQYRCAAVYRCYLAGSGFIWVENLKHSGGQGFQVPESVHEIRPAGYRVLA